jgi:hypothetical protein
MLIYPPRRLPSYISVHPSCTQHPAPLSSSRICTDEEDDEQVSPGTRPGGKVCLLCNSGALHLGIRSPFRAVMGRMGHLQRGTVVR